MQQRGFWSYVLILASMIVVLPYLVIEAVSEERKG